MTLLSTKQTLCGYFSCALLCVQGASALPEATMPTVPAPLTVKMIPAVRAKAHGKITFTTNPDGVVVITGNIDGLSEGPHGIHIHEHGNCMDANAGFKLAGNHFNPLDSKHGSMMEGHMGDLGNIIVNDQHQAQFKIETDKFNLRKNDKDSILGRSIVIHANQDDEKSDPAGNSGERILCGVIKYSRSR